MPNQKRGQINTWLASGPCLKDEREEAKMPRFTKTAHVDNARRVARLTGIYMRLGAPLLSTYPLFLVTISFVLHTALLKSMDGTLLNGLPSLV